MPAHAARPISRAAQQHPGGDHQGARKGGLGPLSGGAEIPAKAPRKKRPGTAIGGVFWPVPARAARPILRAKEQRAGGGHQGTSKKRPWTTIQGSENAGLPRYIGERVDKISV